ncbi:MAG: hypothetical protein JW788_04330 [Candidatus Omnitrophica bacterium]|nr:hypothetical protein [Candidatus Omnitrophota bacterium]
MLQKFNFDNVVFKRDSSEDALAVSGDITNNSNRDYSSVVFRLVILSKEIPLGHVMITINGFNRGRLRHFEKTLYRMTYSEAINKVTGYETYFEGGY